MLLIRKRAYARAGLVGVLLQTRLVPVGLVIVFGAAHGLPVLERGALAGACSRVAIFPAVLAFNLVGDGLRQALDPRLKQRGIV